jgi:phosphoribosyl 1,2-cyclic phosphate phosphodiesterase
VMGLDDVRRFNQLQDATIPCFGDRRTMAELRRTFAYIFESKDPGGGIPRIQLFPAAGAFTLGRQEIVPVPVRHGSRIIYGYRMGGFAYLTDCNGIPDDSWALLEGLDTLVLDALRHRPHPSHFCLSEALEVAARLRPRQTWLTHICHDLPHAATSATLPPGVALAWDGLRIDV